MTPEEFREHACGRKIRYPSRKIARDVAKRVQRKNGGKMHAYRCEFCERFHVGHMSLWQRNR